MVGVPRSGFHIGGGGGGGGGGRWLAKKNPVLKPCMSFNCCWYEL